MKSEDPNGKARRRKISDDLTIIASYANAQKIVGSPPLTPIEVMTIVLEDRRYFRHSGVDLVSVLRELIRLLQLRRVGGASTIEMQFVRTVTGYRGRTFARKLHEVVLAWKLTRRCEKRAVLRSYLSMAYFGTGLTGVESASRVVFGKSAADLNLADAAFLSAMLRYPRPRAAPTTWQARVSARAAYALQIYSSKQDQLRRDHVFLGMEA